MYCIFLNQRHSPPRHSSLGVPSQFFFVLICYLFALHFCVSLCLVIRATLSFSLSRHIVVLQVETRCCTYPRVRDQLDSQQIKVLQVYGILAMRVCQSRVKKVTGRDTSPTPIIKFQFKSYIWVERGTESAVPCPRSPHNLKTGD